MIRIIAFVLLVFSATYGYAKGLLIYVGSASKPPMEKIAAIYSKKTGIKIHIIYGGSGTLLSEMILSKRGDIYMPGSSDFMSLAEEKGIIIKKSIKRIAYLLPAISIPKDNPKHITSITDLAKKGVKIAIANPESVCLGLYAAEIIDSLDKSLRSKIRNNIVNYTGSCSKTATAVALSQVDAAIGWRVFSYWNPDLIGTIFINSYIKRIGYIPAAMTIYSKHRKDALNFLNFLASATAKNEFSKFHYLTDLNEAYKIVGRKLPVGGYYKLPKDWLR